MAACLTFCYLVPKYESTSINVELLNTCYNFSIHTELTSPPCCSKNRGTQSAAETITFCFGILPIIESCIFSNTIDCFITVNECMMNVYCLSFPRPRQDYDSFGPASFLVCLTWFFLGCLVWMGSWPSLNEIRPNFRKYTYEGDITDKGIIVSCLLRSTQHIFRRRQNTLLVKLSSSRVDQFITFHLLYSSDHCHQVKLNKNHGLPYTRWD